MRTTLTIDDDLAIRLGHLRRERNASMEDVINEVLRRGLRDLDAKPTERKPFRTRTFSLGPALVNIDKVTEAIACAEGERFK